LAVGAQQFADQQALDAAKAAGYTLPGLQETPFSGARRQLQVGGLYDERAQAELDESISRALFNQGADNRLLDQYAQIISGGPVFSTGTATGTSSGGGVSQGASRLGGAATGAYLGSQVYPGWGTAIGAILGGIAGG
jgi:hypothetical protein